MKICLKPGFLFYLTLLSQLSGVGLFLPFLTAAAVHELAHVLMIFALGERVMVIQLGFADVEMETTLLPDRVAVLAALAGPAVNLICGRFLGRAFPAFSAVSLLLGLYNLLPVYPLDGGRLVRTLLCRIWPLSGEHVSGVLGFAVCAILLVGAMYFWRQGGGIWPVLGAAGLLFRAGTNNGCFSGLQRLKYRKIKTARIL